MSESKPSLWSRFGKWLGSPGESRPGEADVPETDERGLLLHPAEHPDGDEEEAAGPEARSSGPIARWVRRDQALTQLQETMTRFVDLSDAIRAHMAEQSERTERMSESIMALARELNGLPDSARQQSQSLDAIAAQLEATNTRTQRLAEAVSEVPRAARAQSESLGEISKRLEMGHETDVQIAHATRGVEQSMSSLHEAATKQLDVLRRLSVAADRSHESLEHGLAAQSRRFTLLGVVMGLLAAALAGTVTALILLLGR